jgi:hypothetical protein
MKKLIAFFIIMMSYISFLQAQCLKCSNGHGGKSGQVAMYKCILSPGSSGDGLCGIGYVSVTECVPKSKVNQYQSEGWFICYFGPGWLADTYVADELTDRLLTLPKTEKVITQIFDATGRLVKTFTEINKQNGGNEINWDETDENGNAVTTGLYFVKMITAGFSETRKLFVVR